jgi:hypothetical protein
MTLIEGLLISISLCLNSFLLIYIQIAAAIIIFNYNKLKNLEYRNKSLENKNKDLENKNKELENKNTEISEIINTIIKNTPPDFDHTYFGLKY